MKKYRFELPHLKKACKDLNCGNILYLSGYGKTDTSKTFQVVYGKVELEVYFWCKTL